MHEANVQNVEGGAASGKIRVLLVDDHPVARRGLKSLVNSEQDLMVCAEAENEGEALQALAATDPNIIIMDMALGAADGIDLTRMIHGLYPWLPVVVFSLYGEGRHVQRALAAGACGYVSKTDAPESILTAIRLALAGPSSSARGSLAGTPPPCLA